MQPRPVYVEFFDALSEDGDASRALVNLTRRLISRGDIRRARTIAQALAQYDELRPITDICLALCNIGVPMPEPAWTLFTRNDLALVVSWAAEEYFRLGFRRDPSVATASLARVLSGEVHLDADPHVWIEIAYSCFSAGEHGLVGPTLGRAEAALNTVTDPDRLERLRARVANLRVWLDRASRADQQVSLPDGEVAFALVGFAHPDWASVSRELVDFTETLAAFGHLLRHKDVRFDGASGLVAAARRLREHVAADRRLSGPAATVRLFEVDRDASRYATIPDGTWAIVSDWFTHPLADWHYDVPLDPRLRPIFVSFHITPDQLNTPGAIDYLRAHGPIGCRDRDTVLLLQAAGIPAFFSGALATTVTNLVAHSTLPGRGTQAELQLPAARRRDLGENLLAAYAELCDRTPEAVTEDVRRYAALRALGCPTQFVLADTTDYRAIDYTDLADDDVAAMHRAISDKLAAVLSAVLAGRSEHDVYAAWRQACADDVAAADRELHSFPGYPDLGFDLREVGAAIRASSVVFERTEPGPHGSEVNVEFSVDANYKHQLDIVLDSVVERCSRPVRAFVLCRGYDAADFERMAALFPTVSFVWLRTDRVDHGNVRGKIPWATIVTMDRTMLPELLPDVDRIIHFDLDALCLADFAELFDTDLGGAWVAAVDEPQPAYGRGFNSIRDSASLLRREGQAALAREYLIRTHSELKFDFAIFNAGLMVLDLAALRAADFCGRYLSYVGRFGINGQRVMNVGVGAARTALDPDWNRLLRLEVADEPKVAHWAGPVKPWSGNVYVPGRELWRRQERHFAARAERAR